MIKSQIFFGLAAAATLAGAASAADHTNLEPGLPIEVEDAYPTAYLNREFQLSARYRALALGFEREKPLVIASVGSLRPKSRNLLASRQRKWKKTHDSAGAGP